VRLSHLPAHRLTLRTGLAGLVLGDSYIITPKLFSPLTLSSSLSIGYPAIAGLLCKFRREIRSILQCSVSLSVLTAFHSRGSARVLAPTMTSAIAVFRLWFVFKLKSPPCGLTPRYNDLPGHFFTIESPGKGSIFLPITAAYTPLGLSVMGVTKMRCAER